MILPDLPPFPRVALRVLELLSASECDMKRVVEAMAADPVFTAEVLRMANSALFAFSERIHTVRHAAVALGTDRLRTLATAVAIRSYVKAPLERKYFRMWWRHSLATALLTEGLAAASSTYFEWAYTAGILHDIGRLALMIAMPRQRYARLIARQAEADCASAPGAGERSGDAGIPPGGGLLDIERRALGIDHCDAGRRILSAWKMPPEIIRAAASHHDVLEPGVLEDFVAAACRLASSLGFSSLPLVRPDPAAVLASLSAPGGEPLELDPETLRQAIATRMEAVFEL